MYPIVPWSLASRLHSRPRHALTNAVTIVDIMANFGDGKVPWPRREDRSSVVVVVAMIRETSAACPAHETPCPRPLCTTPNNPAAAAHDFMFRYNLFFGGFFLARTVGTKDDLVARREGFVTTK